MVCLSLIIILLNGCATTSRSTFLGIGTGAALGAVSGATLNQNDRDQAMVNGAIGMAIIGGVVGYFTHGALEDRDAQVRQDTLFNLEKFGVTGFSSTPSYQNDSFENSNKKKMKIFKDEHYSTQGDE